MARWDEIVSSGAKSPSIGVLRRRAGMVEGRRLAWKWARDFMDYFKAVWIPRLGAWTAALKNFPLASLETAAAMEFYQKQLKLRLLNESNASVYKRADWMVDKLGTEVHSYFWLDEYSEKGDFARYQKDEWASGLTAWRRALTIPDSDIKVGAKCVKVSSHMNRDRIHVVWNPGSEFAICDCDWAEMGYLCELVLKSLLDNGVPAEDMNCKNGQSAVDSAHICASACGEMDAKYTATEDIAFQNANRNLDNYMTDLGNGPPLPGDAVVA
ncbi:hypothetical protein MLD38_016495 [Melastoma candidum]|uniref:Uncharacterized protein n=1 Tax=Melastoma candidum TaxID=119954 RepID=A0ACB9QLY7_9MYRT|nr:hypothetical protein MLD38_016495 [Melastoma candidum]